MAGLRLVLVASGAALIFGAIFNVGQPLLAQDELGSSDAGFAVLVTAYGLGFIGGTLSGSRGGDVALLRRRYLTGAFLMAFGFAASGLAPAVAAAVVTFLAAGYGNGMLLIYERLLIQALVPDALAAGSSESATPSRRGHSRSAFWPAHCSSMRSGPVR